MSAPELLRLLVEHLTRQKLVLIWTRDMDVATLVSNVLMTAYFIVGARLEEAKLVTCHGAGYRRYQARVAGLVPLPWKTLSAEETEELLRAGLCQGLVSDRMVGEWPKNVWSVTGDGFAVEAQLENPGLGIYHGYPMPEADPLSQEVIRRWERFNG